jgi:hypothetical protein
MLSQKNIKQETLVYVILWAVLFIAPVISVQFHHEHTEEFPWSEVFSAWFQIANLFLVFLLHNFLLAPLLVREKRRLLYFSSITILLGCFILLQCVYQPEQGERHHPELTEQCPPHPFESDEHDPTGPPPPEHRRPDLHKLKDAPPLIFGQQDLIATLMFIMMLGMNIGVKLYFKQRQDEQLLDHLEKVNLQQQLEYLRYQINPHFLMNTLNNIHALVDIDSERAKETIVELSKIMRYALYEGSRQRVPLSRDVAFMESYIQLMRLRFTTDKVTITTDIAPMLPDCEVPPMMFITFVENAFKHGVSYQQKSFVDISLSAHDDKLLFSCSNSKPQMPNKHASQEGGVGMQNVKRRLQLIYDKRYRLDIDEQSDTYNIQLEIPLS